MSGRAQGTALFFGHLLLAGNRVNSGDSGFGAATNSMAVVDRTGHEEIWPNQSKADVAWDLCSWLLRL